MSAAGVVLVAGEALYDLWVREDGALRGRSGGGPYTVARTVARLGQPAAFLGRLSVDAAGRAQRRELAADGVSLEAVVDAEEPTLLALADLDAEGGATYRFYDRDTAAPGLTPQDALGVLPADVVALHVGTLGLVFAPMAEAVEAVVARLAGRALVAVDPNCRPAAIGDPATYRGRLARVLAAADLVKVSEDDLAWLDPGRPAIAAARALLDVGPAAVLLTRGAQGTTVLTAGGEADVPAVAVEVVDTIGAGDAFGGGFLASWRARGHGPAQLADLGLVCEAARAGARVAAATCARPGADPPRLAELEGGL